MSGEVRKCEVCERGSSVGECVYLATSPRQQCTGLDRGWKEGGVLGRKGEEGMDEMNWQGGGRGWKEGTRD